MNYQKIILKGNIITEPEVFISKDDVMEDYTNFKVSVIDILDNKNIFPISVFGPEAGMYDDEIAKGRQVLIEGRVDVDQSGKFNVLADWLVFNPLRKTTARKSE